MIGETTQSYNTNNQNGKNGTNGKNDRNGKDDPIVYFLGRAIKISVKFLAILMTVVIILGVVDVANTLVQKLMIRPYFILTINDILATFGSFMAVLIAIEIFVNVVLYLRDDILHVKVVMATALMAIARKVIIIDFDKVDSKYLIGIAVLVAAMSLGYWLVNSSMPPFSLKKKKKDKDRDKYLENNQQSAY